MIGLVMDYCVCKDMDHANGELLQNDNSVCIFFVTRVLSFKPRPSQTAAVWCEHDWDQGTPAFHFHL